MMGPNYQRPATQTPAQWSQAQAGGTAADRTALAAWWKGFNDPVLDRLVDRAVSGNPDLQAAAARILQARAQTDAVAGALFPSLSGTGSYKRYRVPTDLKSLLQQPGAGASPSSAGGLQIPSYLNVYQLGFDASWELDLWGGERRALESAQDSAEAAEAQGRGAMISVLAELGTDYGVLRATQFRITVALHTVDDEQQLLDLTQDLGRHGLTSELNIAQAQASLETTRATLPPLRTAAIQMIHAIAILLGELPESLEAELSSDSPPLPVPPAVPVGLPSDLLSQRPDIQQADRELASATAEIGVVVAQRLPNVSLTGSTGYASSQLDALLKSGAWTWNLGASLTAPLFDAGRLAANQRAAEAAAQQQIAAYRKTVLQAYREVEDGLSGLAADREQAGSLQSALAANRTALQRSTDLYRNGLGSYIDVLNADRSVASGDDQLAQNQQTQIRDLIGLYKALGGGWQVAELPNPSEGK
jgi:NodT family efflux transporter outer membrane factor (OMF) lipoprotein